MVARIKSTEEMSYWELESYIDAAHGDAANWCRNTWANLNSKLPCP